MSDRRRTQRYVLGTPLAGDAMPMQDVVVERFVGNHLTVISPTNHTADQELMIHVTTFDGLESHWTRVLSCTPLSSGGAMQYRVELRILPPVSNRSIES